MSPHALFRRLALAEAVTWALLLLGMVVKYGFAATDVLVRVFGMVHGVVFIAYCLVTLFVWVNQLWPAKTGLLALACAVPPFATVWFERRAQRQGSLLGSWRLARGGQQPRSSVERLQAWMLRRPALTVGIGAVAVLTLTGVALLVGPPVPAPS